MEAAGEGALAGGLVGAGIGSIIPGVGTAIGGAVGAVGGAVYGWIHNNETNHDGEGTHDDRFDDVPVLATATVDQYGIAHNADGSVPLEHGSDQAAHATAEMLGTFVDNENNSLTDATNNYNQVIGADFQPAAGGVQVNQDNTDPAWQAERDRRLQLQDDTINPIMSDADAATTSVPPTLTDGGATSVQDAGADVSPVDASSGDPVDGSASPASIDSSADGSTDGTVPDSSPAISGNGGSSSSDDNSAGSYTAPDVSSDSDNSSGAAPALVGAGADGGASDE